MDRAFMDEYYDKMRADDIEELSSQRNEDYSDRADDYKAANGDSGKEIFPTKKYLFPKHENEFFYKYFPRYYSAEQMKEEIIALLEKDYKRKERQRKKEEKKNV